MLFVVWFSLGDPPPTIMIVTLLKEKTATRYWDQDWDQDQHWDWDQDRYQDWYWDQDWDWYWDQDQDQNWDQDPDRDQAWGQDQGTNDTRDSQKVFP
jgi:hypothetical protein